MTVFNTISRFNSQVKNINTKAPQMAKTTVTNPSLLAAGDSVSISKAPRFSGIQGSEVTFDKQLLLADISQLQSAMGKATRGQMDVHYEKAVLPEGTVIDRPTFFLEGAELKGVTATAPIFVKGGLTAENANLGDVFLDSNLLDLSTIKNSNLGNVVAKAGMPIFTGSVVNGDISLSGGMPIFGSSEERSLEIKGNLFSNIFIAGGKVVVHGDAEIGDLGISTTEGTLVFENNLRLSGGISQAKSNEARPDAPPPEIKVRGDLVLAGTKALHLKGDPSAKLTVVGNVENHSLRYVQLDNAIVEGRINFSTGTLAAKNSKFMGPVAVNQNRLYLLNTELTGEHVEGGQPLIKLTRPKSGHAIHPGFGIPYGSPVEIASGNLPNIGKGGDISVGGSSNISIKGNVSASSIIGGQTFNIGSDRIAFNGDTATVNGKEIDELSVAELRRLKTSLETMIETTGSIARSFGNTGGFLGGLLGSIGNATASGNPQLEALLDDVNDRLKPENLLALLSGKKPEKAGEVKIPKVSKAEVAPKTPVIILDGNSTVPKGAEFEIDYEKPGAVITTSDIAQGDITVKNGFHLIEDDAE